MPAHLLAFADIGGERVLCAIATDVRPLADYGKPTPKAGGILPRPYGVNVDRAQATKYVVGTLACAVRRPLQPGKLFVLSCRHVLSRSLIDATEAHANCPVYNWSVGTTPLGKSLAVKGALTDASEESFDSQLAEVTSPSQLGRTLGSFAYDIQQPAAQGPDDIENAFWIATPRNGTNDNRLLVRAVFQGYLIDKEIVYKLPGRSIRVRHAMLIHAVADEVLLDGDSGSPAVRTKGGNRLMGMFIAGNENIAYLIPAWQLLTPKKYGIASEPPWEVVSI